MLNNFAMCAADDLWRHTNVYSTPTKKRCQTLKSWTRVARIAMRAAKNQRESKATRKNAGTDCKRCWGAWRGGAVDSLSQRGEPPARNEPKNIDQLKKSYNVVNWIMDTRLKRRLLRRMAYKTHNVVCWGIDIVACVVTCKHGMHDLAYDTANDVVCRESWGQNQRRY